ncbi:AAA family ATPase [Campylobacter jejuni]|uniref:AAA family ATPase n=1 Tax=Campylobacter jejuni TaxID=197 RepID=UPI000944F494|nr:AAA family ATPase [Campylobacter jejuni]EIV1279243.1 AAA family ATPase [Campylobacter jejuni]OKX99021.1 restriction endonuclease [Campylobacter jejuni]HEB9279501.1 AAA family ATPase [Campylobacter jejuni]
MTKIFSENNKKEIQDIFKKMIDLAMKFYNDRNSTFKDDIEDIQNFFESYEWKLYTGLQTLQKDEYKGFALYKEIEEEEYIKFKKGRSAWHGIYIWFGVSRDDIYMRIVAKEEEKYNALLKIQKDNILDYKLEEKIDKFEEIKDRLFDVFLYLSNYINNLSKDDFKIIKDYNMMKNNTPLNQILYGPPGTGKTYHTIDKALEIILKEEKIQIPSEDDRINRKKLFDEYVKNGQIVFTTFHQSYGYEEFVEGIKPRIDSEENSKEIKYEIKDGIFKELCQKALENYKASLLTQEEFAKNEDLENKIEIFLDELVDQQKFIEKTQSGGFRLEEYNEKYRIITDDTNANLYLNLEIFKTLLENKDKIINGRSIRQILNNKHRRQIDSYYFQLVKLFKEREQNYKIDNNSSKKPDLKFYIIIIDEINRGNVSKIFGELITLIEPSKRIGEKEELKVTLPYSGEKFGVPKNVYIIGTMNTADRSITSLDTALRRRFEFVEMMPDVSKLSMDCEGINLQELLKAINTRIEYLLDREKTIGHAFFVSVENLESLKKVFQNKIIPLLQEYFYNDYALINAVLNDNGMIFEDKKDDKYLQKIKNLDSVNSERSIYNIASFDDKIWDKIEIYQAIYNDEIANKLKNENE